MRVRRVDILEAAGQVDGPRSASARWTERAGVVLRVEDADGRVGLGEASPLPGYSPDTLDGARRALGAVDWDGIPEAEAGEAAAAWLARLPSAEGVAPSARFALETALLDLVGQRRGEPLHRLLGGDATPVPLCVLAGSADDPSVVERAAAAAERGAHTVKLKISGPSLEPLLPILARARSAVAALRLDANWTLVPAPGTGDAAAHVERELARLAAVDPELVEEPAPLETLLSAPSVAVPTALDESLQSPGTWDRVAPFLHRLRCRALVLKPTTLGGFGACLEWAARARARGVDVTVSHAFEGPIALAACAHLALAVASRTRGSGLARHGGLDAWPAASLPMIGESRVTSDGVPGLGVSPALFE